jgi:hypothetical protein
LIGKICAKDPQEKSKYHLILMKFVVNKYTTRTTQKNLISLILRFPWHDGL